MLITQTFLANFFSKSPFDLKTSLYSHFSNDKIFFLGEFGKDFRASFIAFLVDCLVWKGDA